MLGKVGLKFNFLFHRKNKLKNLQENFSQKNVSVKMNFSKNSQKKVISTRGTLVISHKI